MTKLHNIIIVVQHTGKKLPITEVSSEMTANDLLIALTEKIDLPVGTRGVLVREVTHKQILPTQTLESAGILDNELLIADFERTVIRKLTIFVEHTGKHLPVLQIDGDITAYEVRDSIIISGQMTAQEIIEHCADKINLPAGTHGIITRKLTRKQILANQTLREVGVGDGETLIADFDRTAGCFLAGTKITLSTGKKLSIEEIKIGDDVLSYSLKTKNISVSKVVEIYRGIEHRYLVINKSLTVTPTHFVRINGVWQRAGNIKTGDFLQNEQGEPVEVTSVQVENAEIDVYNLNLGSDGVFFANDILVSKYDKDIDANFFADGFLVQTHAAKAIVDTPFPVEKELSETHSLRNWWHTILRTYGRYSCYAVFLSLPSDKEAIRYLLEFGDELDLISAADCLFIAVSKTKFHVSNIPIDNNIWVSAINQQMTEGHSIKLADFFSIDYTSFPCMVLFRDIRSPEHVIITLKDMSAENIAEKMRSIFSLIHKAVQQRDDPLILLEQEKSKQLLLAKGESMVSNLRGFMGKTLEAGMEAWIKTMIK